ncbi:hypothetical protein HPB48_015269 [Haemaphysalis longicornis]|uniref:Uncharacterized protein n=1 Tax=Haemaphysalis longicornis TaxID=44386 RepID=A0A9J6FUL7_HAELO|nr:hypothetical protein HPB48_015269 [Haemaphysalis longicornis]
MITFPAGMEGPELPSGHVHYIISLFQPNAILKASPLVSSDDLTSRNGGSCLDFEVDIQFSPLHNCDLNADIYVLKATRRGVSHDKMCPTKKEKTKPPSLAKKVDRSFPEPPDLIPDEPSSVASSLFRLLGFLILNASACGEWCRHCDENDRVASASKTALP